MPPVPEIVDVTAPGFFRDPYPLYAALRREAPIMALASGGYMLTRHEDIMAVLGSSECGNAPSRFATLHPRNRDRYTAADLAANILPFQDPPQHTVPRRIISGVFRDRFRGFDTELEELADEQVARARDTGATELISQIAEPFTLASICRFIGIPAMDGPRLKQMADDFFYLFAPITDPDKFTGINRRLDEFRDYFRGHLETRRARPGDDLVSRLAGTVSNGERMPDDAVVDTCILLFADGVENVPYGMGNILLQLGNNPARLVDAARSVSVAGALVGEALRLDPPAQLIPRIVQTRTCIRGRELAEGTPLYLALASANRDGTVFENADSFDVQRDRTNALTFGAGRHACIGAGLASLQCSVLLSSLARAGCRPATVPGDVEYIPRFGHRWPSSVMIEF